MADENGHPDLELQKIAESAELDRFCVLEYFGRDRHPKPPQSIEESLIVSDVDRRVVVGAAVSLESLTAKPFFQRFASQIQRPSGWGVKAGAANVRLAILDTQSTGRGVPQVPAQGGVPKPSEHGFVMAQIAAYLAGLEPSDEVGPLAWIEITTRLALKGLAPGAVAGPAGPAGGTVGTYVDLSRAIWAEFRQWRWERRWKGGPQHLVLNLSLGWDADLYSRRDELQSLPSVLGVRRALESVASQGVLVIASAGNDHPGKGATSSPLLPAGWESKGSYPGLDGLPLLIYSVSGVDRKGNPLVSTRTKGEAELVAYGDHVTVPDPRCGRAYTPTLTGSSVSTVVVSTIAAIVWSHEPGLKATEVMEKLKVSGLGLTRNADFSSSSSLPEVRLITLCRALKAASCEGTKNLPSPPPIDLVLDAFKGKMNIKGADFADTSPTNCSLSTRYYLPPDTQYLCPTEKFANLLDTPWIATQPGVDPCPNCTLTRGSSGPPSLSANGNNLGSRGSSYRLRGEIGADLAPFQVRAVTLELSTVDANGAKILASGCSAGISLKEGDTMEVSGFCSSAPGPPVQAALIFTLSATCQAPFPCLPPSEWTILVQSPLFVEDDED